MDVAVGFEPGGVGGGDAHVSETLGPNVSFFCVADGFGPSGRTGPVATFALSTMREFLRRKLRNAGTNERALAPSHVRALLLAALELANARLFELNGSTADFVANGASVTAALVVGEHAFVGHVGDARAYLLRLGRLEILTVDDAMTLDAVPSMTIAAGQRPRRRLLWRSLGTQAKLEASIAHVELLPCDRLVLCTDGFHRTIGTEELGLALADDSKAGDAVARLLQIVRARGIRQNATLVIARDLLAAGPDYATAAPIRWLQIGLAIVLAAAIGAWCVLERPAWIPPLQTTQQQATR